ncbi:MAG: glycosyltransferase [Pseudomonadota bacterium]
MQTPETFQLFWHGRPLPLLQWACLKSFVDMGHKVNLYAYDEIEVPRGVECLSADSIVPRSEIFYFDNNNNNIPTDISPFSDFFRFRLLLEKGGWYIDTDVICNTQRFPEGDFAWAQELPEMAPQKVGTSQIKFPPADPIVRRLYEECNSLKETFTIREQLGPHLISRVLADYALPSSHFGSADSFYPLRWIETYKLWLPSYRDEVVESCKGALFINCYNSLFSYMGLSTSGLPPKGSYLMDLYASACPERLAGKLLTEGEVVGLAHDFFKDKDWAIQELLTVGGDEDLGRINVDKGSIVAFELPTSSSVSSSTDAVAV